MTNRIDRLTDAQIARMPEWVEKWTSIGLSTEPANFDEAEKGVRGCYSVSGLRQPSTVLRMGSPMGAVIGAALACEYFSRENVRENVGANVEANVRANVEANVEANVGENVWANVGANVRANVEANVRANVEANVEANVRANVRENVWAARWGNLLASWYSYVSFFRDVAGWRSDVLRNFTHDERHAVNASWCVYLRGVAAISDRPEILLLNDSKRLDCETGPAMKYRDGWQLWFVDGVSVDEQIVMYPESQSIDQIKNEQNEEVKRIRIERYGWTRYLSDRGANRIHTRRNDIEGTRENLYRVDNSNVLVCACPSTAKVFALEVPPNTETCEQAQHYLSGGLSARIISAS